MTFEKQTKGVPLELVKQGWRLRPSFDDDRKWRDKSPINNWAYETCSNNNSHFLVAQPVMLVNGCRVYAHEGCGDGLAPTPEMAKIWYYWWLESSDLPGQLMTVEVVPYTKESGKPTEYRLYNGTFLTEEKVAEYGAWRGPVLPPVRGM